MEINFVMPSLFGHGQGPKKLTRFLILIYAYYALGPDMRFKMFSQ